MKPFLLLSVIAIMALFTCGTTETNLLPNGKTFYPSYFLPMPVPDNNHFSAAGIALGKKLFYDTRLSGNNTYSCASCHKPELAFTDGVPLAIGSNGKPFRRNAMSLVNLGWSGDLFWDGREHSLESQVFSPITNTGEMNQDSIVLCYKLNHADAYKLLAKQAFGSSVITTIIIRKALAQYLRTLVSFRSPLDTVFFNCRQLSQPVAQNLPPSEQEQLLLKTGFKNYFGDNYRFSDNVILTFSVCIQCHDKSFFGFQSLLRNNGMPVDEKDKGIGSLTGQKTDDGKFKVPTLRNIALTGPYMHDGRFKSLHEVVNYYNSQIPDSPNLDPLLKDSAGRAIRFHLTSDEVDQMVDILKMNTDLAFIKENTTK